MKTSSSSPKLFGLTASIVALLGAVTIAQAATSRPSTKVTASRGCATACADATTITLTSVRSQLPNGRGPQQIVSIGTETRCKSCVRPASGSVDRAFRAATTSAAYHVCNSSRAPVSP